jgi:phosphoribosylaminoimidazole-succinocarboxamide synthase
LEIPVNVVTRVRTPQLEKLHSGKVRDSFRLDAERRLLVVTDRISAFDLKLRTPVPGKGEVLNRLASYWFSATRDVVQNHLIDMVSEQASVVREAAPIRVEMVVRGYMAGSMARGYAKGVRTFSGARVPDGLTENGKLPEPIVTPTTKEDSDREASPDELVQEGFVTRALYDRMAEIALELFRRGTEVLRTKGLVLADTKYELGLVGDQLVLIDEIHTPDSSRIWDAARYAESPADVPPLDKELVRAYLRGEREKRGEYPLDLPDSVVAETRARYTNLFHRVTGQEISGAHDPEARLYEALVARGHLRPAFVAVVASSPAGLDAARRACAALDGTGVRTYLRVTSPEVDPEGARAVAETFSGSLEPGAFVVVEHATSGLSELLARRTHLPVLRVSADESGRVGTSGGAVTHHTTPEGAALAALRSLGLRGVRRNAESAVASEVSALRELDRTESARRGAVTKEES